jgi:large subunit ribosomal protein L6
MSRIGKKIIDIPTGVKVLVKDGTVMVEGPKGKMNFVLPRFITCESKDNKVVFDRANELKLAKSLHGTARAITMNMIRGVTEGYSKTLMIEGVGYKAQTQGKILKLNVGFTHPVEYLIPEGIKIDAAKQVMIVISGIDKAQVGQVAAEIRRVCPPEPYKGKGIRYSDERIRRKVGKAVTK